MSKESLFDNPVYEAARAAMAQEIDALGDRLVKLQEAYEALGGTYADEDEEPAAQPKLLPAPKEPRTRALRKARDVPFTEKQEAVWRLFEAAMGEGDGMVRIDTIAGIYGGMKQRWYVDRVAFEEKLLRLHGRRLISLRGLGYHTEAAT